MELVGHHAQNWDNAGLQNGHREHHDTHGRDQSGISRSYLAARHRVNYAG